jgi:hypothetical protein
LHELNRQRVLDMKNMTYLAMLAGFTLFAAIAALVLTADPVVALIGKLAIAVSLMGFAATATTYLMDNGFLALVTGKAEVDWT